MPTNIEGIRRAIDEATAPGFRGRLLARGQARAIIWRNGEVPEDAPQFSEHLTYDLLSYGYSLLGLGLRLLELGGETGHARQAFEQSASALEAAIARGREDEPERDFHFVLAAAGYHLARYSARAYSLLSVVSGDTNFSPVEQALVALMVRDVSRLRQLAVSHRISGAGSDAAITAMFEREQALQDAGQGTPSFVAEGLALALIDAFMGAMATFVLALEHGESALMESSVEQLRTGQGACAEFNFVPLWWANRVAVHLISDLWDSTFHSRLPIVIDGPDNLAWSALRHLFITNLMQRPRAEIDLWPSQIDAASRAVRQGDDLVVSLPTSAGKTRIAELCILRCLAAGKRVAFVTPLRALSAQTEAGLQRTFAPLGVTISALYGSTGAGGFDSDALRSKQIVVTTPEKLDFALRNDPHLIDDVGLLIFDEGHMIGLSEREVRYEVQIQRLLRRPDAASRRLVCLSAILPDGEQIEDFTNWVCRDQAGGLVRNDWRPTRLRYGEVVWSGVSARLSLRVGLERPFVPNFLTSFIPPIGQRVTPFPRDLGELCLATAWKLVGDGQSVLIYCPVRRSVEPFAGRIIDLHRRGALRSLLAVEEETLTTALALGAEWLGPGHPILECLRLGVVIHHGALPAAYRKEVERLLRDGVLKVTISSPTLAQGLNLSATSVVIHSLHRNRERIETSEFKNVVGRAGRAYVDVEGLVLYPIFDRQAQRLRDWEQLIHDLSSREMESGLLRLLTTLLLRTYRRVGGTAEQFIEYVMNNVDAWTFHPVEGEGQDAIARERTEWPRHLASLDTAILSLVGEQDVAELDLPLALDAALQSSLLSRRLARRHEDFKRILRAGLIARSNLVWRSSSHTQRRGYFLAGLGLETGLALDAIAESANAQLVLANGAILQQDAPASIAAITAFAEQLLRVPPFAPEALPDNWRVILQRWLEGLPLAGIADGNESTVLQFVEGTLTYRLPWAMEAVRIRGIANGDRVGDISLGDLELGLAVSAVETGTLNVSASTLIRAGFNSRLAAIQAVRDTGGVFTDSGQLRAWLQSEAVAARSAIETWPTPESRDLWQTFLRSTSRDVRAVWKEQSYYAPVNWLVAPFPPGAKLHIHTVGNRHLVLDPTGGQLGETNAPLNPHRVGALRVEVMEDPNYLLLRYTGPDDLWLVQ